MQKIKWVLVFVGAVFIQSVFMGLISIHTIRPDILIIILVFYGLRFGRMHSTIAGFIVGIFQDMLSGGFLGLSSFTKSISGFIIGFVSNNESNNSAKRYMATLAAVSIVHNILFFYLYTFGDEIQTIELFIQYVLPASGYTFLIGTLVYYIRSIYY